MQRGGGRSVPSGRRVRHQQQPLSPVVEHDGAVDEQESDRGAGRVAGCRSGVSIQQLCRLVSQIAHQPAGERRQVRKPGTAQRRGEFLELIEGGRAAALRGDPDLARLLLDAQTVPIHQHQGRGVTGHERVPPPAFGALDALQQDSRPLAGDRGEDPDGRGGVGQQLGPHRDEWPVGRQCPERFLRRPCP